MKHYYVNKNAQSDGYHEVHNDECTRLPDVLNREYLGYFNNCKDGVAKAKTIYSNSDGCAYCSQECHRH